MSGRSPSYPSSHRDEHHQHPDHHHQHQQQHMQDGAQSVKGGSGKREQEASLCEELAELISATFAADMNAYPAKADKSAILQDTFSQPQQISKPSHTESGSSSEAVQQSQVSSSKPSIVEKEVLGSLLLEALEGFLFMVNGQGKVEFVSENVTQYLKYSQDDLVGKSIYNIIHVGDHAQFSNSLVPMSLATSLVWPNDSPSKGRNFNCRMLIKPPCDEDDDVEVKQTYVSQYESMHITAILQPFSNFGHKFSEVHSDTETQACLVCIARRMPLTEKVNMMIGIDQFTTKQDTNGKILAADVRSLPKGQYGDVVLNGSIQDYCHNNDISQLKKHLTEVVKNATNTSGVYRFKLQENRYVFVQTKSRLFYNQHNHQPEYIISTHSIIRECDSDVELKGSASTSLMKSIIGQSGLGTMRSQHPAMGLATLPSPMSMHTSMLSNPGMSMGGVGMGMSSMAGSGGGGVGGMSSSGGSVVSGMDPLSELDIFDWDLTPSLGGGSSSGLIGNDSMGGFNGGLSMSGVNVSGVNTGSVMTSMQQGFTSTASSWASMSQVKTSMPQQRGLEGGGATSTSSLQSALLGNYSLSNMTNSNNMVTMNTSISNNVSSNGKPIPSALASQLQRSNSVNFESQKSPHFSPAPSPGVPRSAGGPFSIPAQRPVGGVMGYPNQRSPGSAGGSGGALGVMQNRSHTGQFSMGYRKNMSPLVSPQPGMSPSPVWGRSPNPGQDFGVSGSGSMTSQPSPLQALQSMDTQTSSALDMLSPSPGRGPHSAPFPSATSPYDPSNPGGSSGDLRSGQRPGKLCQLLTQNTSPLGLRSPHSSAPGPRPSSTKSAMSMASPGMGKSGMKSPDDCTHQSPTPGPGTSPPEKPQSTSNEDGDGGSNGLGDVEKKDNFILKKLLSEDEEGDPPNIMDHEISSSPQTSSASAAQDKMGLDKNEAEPKKPNNVLLKQLLSEENREKHFSESLHKRLQQELIDMSIPRSRSVSNIDNARGTGELIHQLLQEEENNRNTITSAPAESTSQEDMSGSRSRHQSGQQEPQSTSSLPLTPSPSHHPHMGSMPTPSTSMSPQVSMNQHLMQELFMDKLAASSTSGPSSSTSAASLRLHDLHSSLKDNDYPRLLKTLYDEGMDSPMAKEMMKQRKRKASLTDAESVDMENEPSTSSGGPGSVGSKLSQQNALLVQLLSKKANKENVVNTQLTINPMGLPQNRLPKNVNEKIVSVRGGRSNSVEEASSSGGEGPPSLPSSTNSSAKSTSTANLHNNPRNNPSSFSGNTSKVDSSSSSSYNASGVFSSLGHSVSGMEHREDRVNSPYEQFQQQLSSEGLAGMETEAISNDSNDPLLQQVLQQVLHLEEIGNLASTSSAGPGNNVGITSTASTPHSMSAPSTPLPPQLSQPAPPTPTHQQQAAHQQLSFTPISEASEMSQEDQNMLAQLEQLINDGSLQGMESLLELSGNVGSPGNDMQGGNVATSVSEQMAINAIQRQLMGEDLMNLVSGNTSMGMGGGMRAGSNVGGFMQGPGNNSPISPVAGMGPRGVMAGPRGQHPQLMSQMQMGPRPFPGPLPPSQVSPAGAMSPGQESQGPMFSPQGMPPQSPQFPQPRGPLASALQGGQQGPFPPRTGVQVRQTLLQQQKNRQMEKRQRQQAQERRMLQQQRLILQQQQQQQQGPQQFGQRFPQPNMASMDTSPSPGQFPENLRDLMNTGHAPNVTIPVQGAQFADMGRHRSLSGNSLPSPGGQPARFQFPGEGQFSAPQGPMFSPGQTQGVPTPPTGPNAQQQQMFPQNRMLQRSLSMNTGRGSPRASQSPFTGSPDPLLLSPHAMSPNSSIRQPQQQPQVSPPFSQGPMTSTGFNHAGGPPSFSGPAPIASSAGGMPSTFSSTHMPMPSVSSAQPNYHEFDFFDSSLQDSKKILGDMGMGGPGGSATSQYVKQELRNICSARSEKQMQTQLQQHQQQHFQQQQQQQQQQSMQHSGVDFDTSSELPLDILATINDMEQDHSGQIGEEAKEDEVVTQARQEAKKRYKQFRALSTSSQSSVPEELDEAEAKATSLFRNQLLRAPPQGTITTTAPSTATPIPSSSTGLQQVNIVQKEPRTPVDIKPQDNKNSLLQQLLADY